MTAGHIEASTGVRWAPLLGGLVVLYAVLQGAAGALSSVRGEAGLIVAAATLAAALLIQRVFFASSWAESWRSLGLGLPRTRGTIVASALCVLMLAVIPAYLLHDAFDDFYPNAAWLALGILAQAGLAEELVFRGFLYGHIRRRHAFWRAALLSMLPFALVHLTMFATMDWPVALAALVLAVAISFPLAHLDDLAGRTIWAPAAAHAVIQGAPKLIVADDPMFILVWMGAVTLVLWLAFFVSSSAGSRS